MRKEIRSDLEQILAENQNEMMKLVAPMAKQSSAHQNAQDSDSESENISVARKSTPVKTNTSISKTTPVNSRNRHYATKLLKTLDFKFQIAKNLYLINSHKSHCSKALSIFHQHYRGIFCLELKQKLQKLVADKSLR